jgi:hypothetical protein
MNHFATTAIAHSRAPHQSHRNCIRNIHFATAAVHNPTNIISTPLVISTCTER